MPPPSKGELRAQIEKLEAANAALRAKSREANRNAKAAARRIAELEAEAAQRQEEATQAATPEEPVAPAKAARVARSPRRSKVDPGDGVPPGVAVEQPQAMDAEAVAARDALEDNLSDE